MRKILQNVMAVAVVLIGVAAANCQTAPAGAAPEQDVTPKARLTQAVETLRAGPDELRKAGLSTQAKELRALIETIDESLAVDPLSPQEHLEKLEAFKGRLNKIARMWGRAEQQEKADALARQADIVAEVCVVFKEVAQTRPASARSDGQVEQPDESIPQLTVVLSMEAPPEPAPSPRNARSQRQPPRSNQRTRRNNVRSGTRRSSSSRRNTRTTTRRPASLPPGAYPGMPPGTMVPGVMPNRPGAMPPMSRFSGRSNSGKTFTVNLRESNETFTGGNVNQLARYLNDHAPELESTAVTFEIGPDVAWARVRQVVAAFAEAPLGGEMRFAGFDIRRPPRRLVLGVTPPGPTEPLPK